MTPGNERGTPAYNLALGEPRAAAVRDYLAALGVGADHVRTVWTVSYGKERPFAQGRDEESWQQNRRAHFVLTGPPGTTEGSR